MDRLKLIKQWDLRIKDTTILFSPLRSRSLLFLWEMIILGHYEPSFIEVLFSSRRVRARVLYREVGSFTGRLGPLLGGRVLYREVGSFIGR